MRSLVLLLLAALVAGCVTDSPLDSTASPPDISSFGTTGEPATTSTASGETMATPAVTTTSAPAQLTRGRSIRPSETTGTFVDVTEREGLVEPLLGMHGHAAAWGDVDGDEVPDLVVGSFGDRPPEAYRVRGAEGPSEDVVLMGDEGFELGGMLGSGRTSGAVFADLDGDGDDDLVLSRNVKDAGAGGAPTTLFENVGGRFDVVAESGLGPDLGGRSVGVLDFDRDGLLDLFVVEDRYAGGSSRLFRNDGGLRFTDVTAAVGLPSDLEGLGVATVDLSGDGRSDVFVAGSNRLFVWEDGRFAEVVTDVFEWETHGAEDLVAGVATGDVDRDGRLDLVIGHHFNSTVDFDTEVPVRLYLNRTDSGDVRFVDATEQAGLVGIPTKAPHVEIVDVDNDGWPDIVTSASAGDGTTPAVFLHRGLDDDIPVFQPPAGLGSDHYWVAAPTADYDGDGRRDVFAVEWDPGRPSILFENQLEAGGSIEVRVEDGVGGIGSTVRVYEAGAVGDPGALLSASEIVASVGYSSGVERAVHVGLGERLRVDVVVQVPGDDRSIVVEGVETGTRLTIDPRQAS